MSAESTVVIAPPDLLPRIVGRLTPQGGEVIALPDTDIQAAIERTIALAPDRVSLERLFAATSRGAALLSRLKADPALAHTEFRIVSHDSDYWRVSPRRAAPGDALPQVAPPPPPVTPPSALDQHGTRRAARMAITDGVEVLVDGSPARLVDLSAIGGQVLSATVLRPNQRVRVSMVDGRVTLRCQATVVWARFELGRGELGPRYRAGLEFSGADSDDIAEYARRHQKKSG